MGIMDILNGMRNGPHGQGQPTAPGRSGGMSPIMMALLGLLAYKAVKGGGLGHILGGGQPGTPAPTSPTTPTGSGGGLGDILGGMLAGPRGNPGTPAPTSPSTRADSGGGLGDILGSIFGGSTGGGTPRREPGDATGNPSSGSGGLGGILGGLLGGAGAGSLLNSGLGQIIQDLQRSGQGDTAKSWVSSGDNDRVDPEDLGRALGADTIDQLGRETGMERDELLRGLADNLPQLVDHLTPHGRLPTDEEASRW